MDKEDARYQTLEQLHERRKQVVRLHKRGIKVMQLVQMTGLSYPAVRRVLDLFEQGGWAGIQPAGRGRAKGDSRLLTPQQEAHIQKTICDKRPEQLKMDFFLWSRAAVMQLIEQECGLKLGVRTVGKYLARWGFTPQRPVKRALEQRPEQIAQWLKESYPAVRMRARAEGAVIFWGMRRRSRKTQTGCVAWHHAAGHRCWRRRHAGTSCR